jgi:hypothetical protein
VEKQRLFEDFFTTGEREQPKAVGGSNPPLSASFHKGTLTMTPEIKETARHEF